MIKLNRPAPPKLTISPDKEIGVLRFKTDGVDVWNDSSLRNELLNSSFHKCAYCESKIDEESKYMEVDHFECKSLYPDKVLDWDNLLPSCKKCNGTKHNHDVVVDPIVNPYLDEPRHHLDFFLYRFMGKTEKGKLTEEIVGLNDMDRLTKVRFLVGEKISENLHKLRLLLTGLTLPITTRNRNIATRQIIGLMKEGQANTEYSATAATVILHHLDFIYVKQRLNELGIWDAEMESLYKSMKNIAY